MSTDSLEMRKISRTPLPKPGGKSDIAGMKPVKPVVTKIVKTLDMRGLKQTELESAAALSANRVSKWKDGVGEPSASEACRISRVLNVPLEWLCDDDAPAEPPEPQAAWLDVVMELIRVSGLTREDVVKRLMLGPVKVDVPDPNHPELAAVRRRLAELPNGGNDPGKGKGRGKGEAG